MPRRDRICYTGLCKNDFGTSERAKDAYGIDESGVTPTNKGDAGWDGERDEDPSQNPIAVFIMWLMRCFGVGTNDKSSGGGGIPEITKDKEILKLYEMFIKQKEGTDICPRITKLNTAAVHKFLGITGGRKTRRRRSTQNKSRRRRRR